MKLCHMFRQQETERLEAGLQRPRFQREIVSMPRDAINCTLPNWHSQKVGQPQQLALYCVSIFQLAVEDDERGVSCVDVALVPSGPLPPFI